MIQTRYVSGACEQGKVVEEKSQSDTDEQATDEHSANRRLHAERLRRQDNARSHNVPGLCWVAGEASGSTDAGAEGESGVT